MIKLIEKGEQGNMTTIQGHNSKNWKKKWFDMVWDPMTSIKEGCLSWQIEHVNDYIKVTLLWTNMIAHFINLSLKSLLCD